MKVMDCRYRPTTAAWMDTFVKNPVYAEYVKITGFDRKPVKDLDACVAQLAELGVEKAVITGRDIESTFAAPSSNPLVDASVAAYPSLFIGVYGYDPHKGMKGYRAMKKALEEKRSAGASIEPGMSKCPVDSALYYPLYALCCDHDVPVMITAGLSPHMPGVLLDVARASGQGGLRFSRAPYSHKSRGLSVGKRDHCDVHASRQRLHGLFLRLQQAHGRAVHPRGE